MVTPFAISVALQFATTEQRGCHFSAENKGSANFISGEDKVQGKRFLKLYSELTNRAVILETEKVWRGPGILM